MTPEPRFKKGDSVLLSPTGEMGQIVNDPVLDYGEYWYCVRFRKRVTNVVEAALEPLPDLGESLQQLARRGRWGRMQAFLCALAVERISHANQNTFYSFRAHRILFQPYQ